MNKSLSRALVSAVACAALILVSGVRAAHAQVFSLASLLAGTGGTDGQGNILVGDKLFQFANGLGGYSTIGVDMPTAANVNVQGQLIAGNPGLEFTGFWHANPGSGAQTAIIDYHVLVLDPLKYISDVHLDGDPTVDGGLGQASVVESVSTHLTHTDVIPRTLSIFDIVTASSETTRLNDFLFTNGTVAELQYLHIEKTINVSADSPNTLAQVTHIQQSFSQSNAAPEPASLALLAGLGVPVLGLIRRRRSV